MGARIDGGGQHAAAAHPWRPAAGRHRPLSVTSLTGEVGLLLAGLYAHGETVVREPHPTRDYTERMLSAFGVEINSRPGLRGCATAAPARATDGPVPTGTFSSAAFFLDRGEAEGLRATPAAKLGLNPRRTGLLTALRMIGADITEERSGMHGGEASGRFAGALRALHGIEVPEALVPGADLNRFPALFIAAACAKAPHRGAWRGRVAGEEIDRLGVMAAGLRTLGLQVDETPDGAIHPDAMHGRQIVSQHDHRIAMAFAVAAQRAAGKVLIRDVDTVATSVLGFAELARAAGFGLV